MTDNMKKLFYSLFVVLSLGCTFVSCGDDDDDANYNYTTTPEIASAGTYIGTWTRTLDGVAEEFSGSVTLTATDRAGVTNVQFVCEGATLDASSVANIWNANDGFGFMQQITTGNTDNGLGAAFAGRVLADGSLTTSFTLTQRQGRVTKTYIYNFTGSKNGNYVE